MLDLYKYTTRLPLPEGLETLQFELTLRSAELIHNIIISVLSSGQPHGSLCLFPVHTIFITLLTRACI